MAGTLHGRAGYMTASLDERKEWGSVGHYREKGNGRLPWFVRLSSCMLIRGPRGKELSSGRSACYILYIDGHC